MASQIPENEIRWIQNGEPHDSEVYNRPSRDLRVEVNTRIDEINQDILNTSQGVDDAAIVYAIALG